MRIQHNIMAMNAYRNLGKNNGALNKNLEKLSSGYRINRAGDDAAGLAISEKMRAQIAGLDQAQKNAQSGINLVQTAEGALTEVHDMLNRMTTLATQAANGTYSKTDREKIQSEINALSEEIDRIADNSNFNGTKLLDGGLAKEVTTTAFTGGTTAATTATANIPAVDGTVKTVFEVSLDNVKFDFVTANNANTVAVIVGGATLNSTSFAADAEAVDIAKNIANNTTTGVSINGVTYNVTADGNKLVFTMSDESAAALTAGQAPSFSGNFGVSITTAAAATQGKIDGTINVATQLVTQGTASASEKLATANLGDLFANANIKDGANFQIGDKVYVLAMTKETAAKEYASKNVNVIDLTDFVEDDGNGGVQLKQKTDSGAESLNQAQNHIIATINKTNEMFSVGMDANDNVTIQEKSTYEGDVDLTDKKTLENQFKKGVTIAESSSSASGSELTLQIGSSAEETIDVAIESMKADALGIKDLDISDPDKANAAIDTINAAIEKVSVQRANLGAVQNRLEHTINNLGVMEENIQDAEANIRDTDIADEMMAYTKNNILIQSAQAMLAQANQVPQGVLQLMG